VINVQAVGSERVEPDLQEQRELSDTFDIESALEFRSDRNSFQSFDVSKPPSASTHASQVLLRIILVG
jgi:hypothetical protein